MLGIAGDMGNKRFALFNHPSAFLDSGLVIRDRFL